MLERWWSDRYNLPPNHPLFVSQSVHELLEEFLMHKIQDKDRLRADADSGELSGQELSATQSQINAIDALLEGREKVGTGDPLADYWEAQIDAGEEPNFDLTMEEFREMQSRGEL